MQYLFKFDNLHSPTFQNIVNIDASDADWTLALEQLLIFALVLAKWISPKGGLSLDELSQLLLVNIAAGADIIELMETFNEEQVKLENVLVLFCILDHMFKCCWQQGGFVFGITQQDFRLGGSF